MLFPKGFEKMGFLLITMHQKWMVFPMEVLAIKITTGIPVDLSSYSHI